MGSYSYTFIRVNDFLSVRFFVGRKRHFHFHNVIDCFRHYVSVDDRHFCVLNRATIVTVSYSIHYNEKVAMSTVVMSR